MKIIYSGVYYIQNRWQLTCIFIGQYTEANKLKDLLFRKNLKQTYHLQVTVVL